MITINQLAEKINGSIEGKGKTSIAGVGDLRTAPKNFASFLSIIVLIVIKSILFFLQYSLKLFILS